MKFVFYDKWLFGITEQDIDVPQAFLEELIRFLGDSWGVTFRICYVDSLIGPLARWLLVCGNFDSQLFFTANTNWCMTLRLDIKAPLQIKTINKFLEDLDQDITL